MSESEEPDKPVKPDFRVIPGYLGHKALYDYMQLDAERYHRYLDSLDRGKVRHAREIRTDAELMLLVRAINTARSVLHSNLPEAVIIETLDVNGTTYNVTESALDGGSSYALVLLDAGGAVVGGGFKYIKKEYLPQRKPPRGRSWKGKMVWRLIIWLY